ncbi:hypothetical protein APA_2815 [Pseudanabaena sp. lw0831]|uniref:hypothetical protein n=1 Tax=Pseudanabaena sp. lw0831 TaxID=1357935 RepID=UPI0019161F58|nr:hypothetical protein [Pseudanabaena sp. lw0831]GBO54764.1 hypothetical protein APA_2815 [Pseudanabaena sp. lw0831]
MKKIRYLAIAIFVLALVWTGALAAQTSSYNTQVNNGVAYFRNRANDQLPLVENLVSALNSGDLERAKTAYVNSRPPYEEIEVYAGSFEKEDTDIDARPYAIDGGETSPEYKGFHKSVLSKDIVAEEESAYRDCLKTVAPFFRSGEIAAMPNSQVLMTDRGAIVRASYRYRDVLLKSKAALKIPDPA